VPHPNAESVLHVIATGAIKACALLSDGNQRVIAFHFPGSVVDLTAYSVCDFKVQLVALQPTSLCALKISRLQAGLSRRPAMLHQLVSLFTTSLTRELALSRLWQDHSAEQRLTAALLDISVRLSGGDPACDSFVLPMTHRDLADYLGMTPETISRQFRRLAEGGYLSSRGRRINLLNRPLLESMAGNFRPGR
jgi:CRP/FNR family transcriptional regulator